jgi:two-component system sensor histidine kinase QseC
MKDALGSLRVRLAAAMLTLLVLALAASSLLDRLWQTSAVPAEAEPYQDAIVLAVFSAVVIALVWIVSLWSLRPLAQAAREAGEAGPAHPGARISATDLPTEIRPLVASVNAALDRMEAAYDAERRFTANAAHELRTPLSVLSLRLQQAQTSGAADWPGITADLRHMTRLVGQLLDLARKEQAGRAEPAGGLPVLNLSRVAREAAAAALPLAEAANRRLAVHLPADLPVRGRADDLRDAVLNLLDNAIKHGTGDIFLSAGRSGAGLHLDVADAGEGPPAALRELLFERFRKAQASPGGTGLGLAIVREVARGHGGDASFLPTPTCTIRLQLPDPGP